jgi:hypothetical protein
MTAQTNQDASRPFCARTERMRDLLIVSSFGFWAVILGFAPVLAFYLVMRS